jgi:hypothetical protein
MAHVLEFEVGEHGWASAAIILNERRNKLDMASFVYDTFYEMAGALVSACNGATEAEWLYFHEPGATYAILRTGSSGQAILTILVSKEGDRVVRPKIGYPTNLVAEGPVGLRDMVTDVITAGSRMLEKHGAAGYKQHWRHDFPEKEIELLKQWRRDQSMKSGA